MRGCNEDTNVVGFEGDGFSVEHNGEIVKIFYIGDGEPTQEIALPDGCVLHYHVFEDI